MEKQYVIVTPQGSFITNPKTGGSFSFSEVEAFCRQLPLGLKPTQENLDLRKEELKDFRFVELGFPNVLDRMDEQGPNKLGVFGLTVRFEDQQKARRIQQGFES